MKKPYLLLSFFIITFLTLTLSCKKGGSSARFNKNNSNSVDSVLNSIVSGNSSENSLGDESKNFSERDPEANARVREKLAEDFLKDKRKIDTDLTVMESNMVYAEVYNMMIYPEQYIGKIVKMKGQFFSYHDEYSGNSYYGCLIQDALACCSSGLEFSLKDKSLKYPDDYPQEGEEITVIGKFTSYTEDDVNYLSLFDAVMM